VPPASGDAGRGATERADLCGRCRHFFVTWHTDRPWGCRALEFESARRPCLVVREASGLSCQSFAARVPR